MREARRKTVLGLLVAGLLLLTAAPASAQVGRIELDIAGYLCGF